jgi:hypothetical protein
VGTKLVFILGATVRTGTNYLRAALKRHADCAVATPVEEDHLLRCLGPLDQYLDDLSQFWRGLRHDEAWEAARCELRKALVAAEREWIVSRAKCQPPPPVLVLKTPSPIGIGCYREFEPAQVLAIVRDGRDVVESAVNTTWPDAGSPFWDFTGAAEAWQRGARCILDAEARGVDFCLVRYEQLVTSFESTITHILEYLTLDVRRYDFEAGRQVPVIGSAFYRGPNRECTWKPLPKPDDFQPIGRWKSTWCDAKLARFMSIAGREMRELGYCD